MEWAEGAEAEGGRVLKRSLLICFFSFAFSPVLILIPRINRALCRSWIIFCRSKRRRKGTIFALEIFAAKLSSYILPSFMPRYLVHLFVVLPL